MKFFADESVDRPIVDSIRQLGHAVLYVAEMSPGVKDETILREAHEQNALLLTADKDFGELVFRQKRASSGVILLRLAGLTLDAKARTVSTALEDHAAEMPGAFSVITPGAVRIRRAPGSEPAA